MKVDYKEAIKVLKIQLCELEVALKLNKTSELVKKKVNILNAIKWLEISMQFQISPKFKIFKLPENRIKSPSAQFRVVDDNESDNFKNWEEICDGKIRLISEDLVILKSKD